MATKATQSTDEKATKKLAESIGYVVGIDGSGDVHVHYPASPSVAVFDVGADYQIGDRLPADPEIEQDLTGRSLNAWMTYTQTERGIWERTTRHAQGQDQ